MKRADLAKRAVEQLRRLPPPYDSHYGVVPARPPTASIALGEALAAVEGAQRALVEAEIITRELKDPFLVSRILTRKEALSSSAIEDTHSTLDALLSLEETGEGEAAASTRQVRDYAAALENLLPRAAKAGPAIFSLELVLDLHRDALKSDPDYADSPGKLRERVVWIGGTGHIATSTFNPPPPDAVQKCLEETVAYMRCDDMQAMTQGLITRMAIAHAHFEAVHPFRAASSAVQQLVESGILTERTGYKRNRLFAAEEAIRILNRPFGAS